ncbi:hypothetical protein MTR_7g103110 [Medicago truncatula]|uniref:Uncharacterized protein n=1 Tax=Medicago truncatula TaxID=3880 RepID=A0A072UE18_MEDTR|nr:hypothetical protein MTR_7g103110 [Medicago truncatula]
MRRIPKRSMDSTIRHKTMLTCTPTSLQSFCYSEVPINIFKSPTKEFWSVIV